MIIDHEQDLKGVVCLHCGMHTALAGSKAKAPSNGTMAVESNPHLSIVRCHECGKEAPYLAGDIVFFRDAQGALRSAA